MTINEFELTCIIQDFIRKHDIACAEDIHSDSVSEDCYSLIEQLADVVGYANEV
jgi:hypothetical protein